MATLANQRTARTVQDPFWLITALVMTTILIGGFSLQLVTGRSTFAVPYYVHVHALLFFGWTMLYLVQNALVGTGNVALHRRLGWLATLWIPAMVVLGLTVVIAKTRHGTTPFFFQPLYFLVMDVLTLLAFAGLAVWAIRLRRQTQWHRRLMFCGMAILIGPGAGRLLPMPLLIPHAGWGVFLVMILFPLAGIVRDLRRDGRVHPAWFWGVGVMITVQITIEAVTHSAPGLAFYAIVTHGTPGAGVAPLAFPPFPTG